MVSPAQNLPQFLATRVPLVIMDLQPPKAYLGGIPFYLLYDGHSFSLKLLIGAVGTGLIFLAMLLCAICYLVPKSFVLKKKALLDPKISQKQILRMLERLQKAFKKSC